MSCSCGGCGCAQCAPVNCQPAPCCTIQLPDTEPVEYTFENQNESGIGFFDNETNNLVGFRGIASESLALIISLDAPSKTILIDFDGDLLIGDIPDASTTERGILETATDGEAQAKLALNKILTPSNLAALGSSTVFAGLVELATSAETITGTSTTLAVTPAGLAAAGALYGTVTFADAVARGLAVPAFSAQFGGQVDTEQAFIAGSTSAGDWHPIFTFGISQNAGVTDTTVIHGGALLFGGNGTGSIVFQIDATVDGGSRLAINPLGELDFDPQSVISINGTPFAADRLLGTDAAGEVAAKDIGGFISIANTQTGWGVPTGTLARTTFVSYAGQTVSNPPTQAEVQAIDDALVIVSRRLAALVTDVMAVKLPSA